MLVSLCACGKKAPAPPTEVDVDLSILSKTMVYGEVFQMVTEPEKYVGKTIKMRGLFNYFYDVVTEDNYYYCLIQDATACCGQGIEFRLGGKHAFPDDYPQENEEFTVVGTFASYQEGEETYYYVRDAVFVD